MDVNGFATGAVQVFRSGGFGAVCAQDFGNRDARVACRQLGFFSGTVIRAAHLTAEVRTSTASLNCSVLETTD